MSRIVVRTWQTLFDLSVLFAALWVAFLIRFDGDIPLHMLKRLILLGPYVVAFELLLMVSFGVHRFVWRYVGLYEAQRILMVMAVSAGGLLALRFVAGAMQDVSVYSQFALIPIGVTLINFALSFLGVVGVRVSRRLIGERSETLRRRPTSGAQTPTILIGAGQAGVLVAKEIAGRPDLGMTPVGFVDDDVAKTGTRVHGLPVLGTTENLARFCTEQGAQQALITIANAPGSEIRRITRLCEGAHIPVKIIPGLYELVGGTVSLSRIRDVAIEDLLGREPVQLDAQSIAQFIQGRTVLVTGAGGSIGSELCRQVLRFAPRQVLLIERAENSLFEIHRELLACAGEIEIVPLLADISDRKRIDQIFSDFDVAVVLHAAAHKHVPMMEWNAAEAIKNNVFGTRVVADVADEHGASVFVQVSTDKAVNPTSVMGASKRVAEMYLQTLSMRRRTRFVTVRLGNVLGSNGSVIPIFRKQIASGGPVTVTHPEMQRYFMMIPEACQLILQAGALAHGGEIFVLDMGSPVKIVDLARDMIRLSGYEPDREMKIEFTGVRPGEKLYEELLLKDEHYDRTVHPKIVVGRIPPVSDERMGWALRLLGEVVEKGTADEVRARMALIIPEARLTAEKRDMPSEAESLPVQPLANPIPRTVY